MVKAFLFKPRWDYPHSEGDSSYNRIWFPLSLATCASVLKKQGWDVVLHDFHAERELNVQKVVSEIHADDCVFITSADTDRWQCPYMDVNPVLELAKEVKMRTENLYLMGPHGTADPELMLQQTRARAVIRGEPEHTVGRIGSGYLLKNIPGISFQRPTGIVHTPNAEDILLDTLPSPDLSLLGRAQYEYELFGGQLYLMETSRNCLSGCEFCNKTMYGSLHRKKSVARIIEEIRAVRQRGVTKGKLIDLNITADIGHLRELCTEMKKEPPGFEWYCQARIDVLDEELISLMSEAGCRLIDFGVESGSESRRAAFGKTLNAEKIRQTLTQCRKHGITTLSFYILGFPDETLEEAQETIDHAFEINSTYAAFHLLTCYKGTPIFDASRGKETFSYTEPQENKLRSLLKMRRKAHLRYYLRPRYFMENAGTLLANTPLQGIKFFLSYFR